MPDGKEFREVQDAFVTLDFTQDEVMDVYSSGRRSDTGSELVEFCKTQGLSIASSYYLNKERCTWWHPRYASSNELDHFLIKRGSFAIAGCCILVGR